MKTELDTLKVELSYLLERLQVVGEPDAKRLLLIFIEQVKRDIVRKETQTEEKG